MFHGLDLDVVRDLVARFGSLAMAEATARQVPGFDQQIQLLGLTIATETAFGKSERAALLQEEYWALVAAALPPEPPKPNPLGTIDMPVSLDAATLEGLPRNPEAAEQAQAEPETKE